MTPSMESWEKSRKVIHLSVPLSIPPPLHAAALLGDGIQLLLLVAWPPTLTGSSSTMQIRHRCTRWKIAATSYQCYFGQEGGYSIDLCWLCTLESASGVRFEILFAVSGDDIFDALGTIDAFSFAVCTGQKTGTTISPAQRRHVDVVDVGRQS